MLLTGLALGNFVFVVREYVIDAAAMDIERVAEILHRHGRTFQMPAGTADTERRVPSRFLVVLWSLPQDEIVRLFLLVFIRIDSRADLQFTLIEVRTVFRKPGNLKYDSRSNPLRDTRDRISRRLFHQLESFPECSRSPG